eukprot:2964606-Prymnesium_polylepis.3
MEPRLVELSSSTVASLRLPAHVGRGSAAIARTSRSECLSDKLAKLRVENAALLEQLADPLRRPPQAQLEIGVVKGELTDANPIDRIVLLRVAAELFNVALLPVAAAVELYASTRRALQAKIREEYYPDLGGATFSDTCGQDGQHISKRLLRYLPVARVPNCSMHESNILGNPGQRRWHNASSAKRR